MKLFYKPEAKDEKAIYEAVQKGYGIKGPWKVNGYRGTYLYSIGEVYVSDELEKQLAEANFPNYLNELIHRFEREDYGDITQEEELRNIEQRYIDGGSWMIGRYTDEYGTIIIETLPGKALGYFSGEAVAGNFWSLFQLK